MQNNPEHAGTEKSFCTQCGNPISPADKFCGICGNPAKTASPAPVIHSDTTAEAVPQHAVVTPITPVVEAESVVGAFLAARKKGIFSFESFHTIVTSKRLIYAAFTNEMVKQAAKEAGQTGFLAGIAAAATVGHTYYKKYLSLDPEAALKENPQNFVIPLTTIRKIKLEMGSRHRDPKTKRETWDDSKLEIETSGEKYSFKVSHQTHDQARDVLSSGRLI